MGDDFMFSITETAREELQNRLTSDDSRPLIRLQMRHSCFMKLKLTFEKTIEANDTEMVIDGLHFIIDRGQLHYFQNKKIDFIPDRLNFKQFEAI
jgi:Fe-S cluster assembly iron-binding protein IscA